MKRSAITMSWRVNGPLTPLSHIDDDPKGEALMAATQQGILTDNSSTLVDELDTRLSLPEATMFIVASSGALWVLLFGIANFFLG